MKVYKNFIGIDIGKFQFVCSLYGSNETHEFENNKSGFKAFLKKYKESLKEGLCILETTGGYEMALLTRLCEKKIHAHRANTRKVKHFICSYSNKGKSDKLDAKGLSFYGHERHKNLPLFEVASEKSMTLTELVNRRDILKKMIVAEKNRLKGPRIKVVKSSSEKLLEWLTTELNRIELAITEEIEADSELQRKKNLLKTIPGIADTIANHIVVRLPELGMCTRREIASLVGLAPRVNESGCYRGYRAVQAGREGIKPYLFLSAMAASGSNSHLKTYYNKLLERGKKKKVALTALMRKIIVIANAKVKEAMFQMN